MDNNKIQIIDYTPEYQRAFKDLNVEWISRYFVMEEADYKALDHPDDYILRKGGHILIALYDGEPVGACALIKMTHEKYDFELAKMAISPKVQGKGLGFLIGEAAKERARREGGKMMYLESNTILTPAMGLYKKLGFVKIEGLESPYVRCNIQMELDLTNPFVELTN